LWGREAKKEEILMTENMNQTDKNRLLITFSGFLPIKPEKVVSLQP